MQVTIRASHQVTSLLVPDRFNIITKSKERCSLSYLEQAYIESHFFHIQSLVQFEKQKFLSKGVYVGLQNLVLTYVNAISSGDLPCMENAVMASAQIENSAAVQKAMAHYDGHIGSINANIKPEIYAMNFTSKRKGLQQKDRIRRKDVVLLRCLLAHLEKRRDDFYKENMKASSDRCSALLKDIFHSLEEDIKQGVYSKSGGYRLLTQTVQELKKKYLEAPKKGIQVNSIYLSLLLP
ncbi:PREDICTED: guanylate-binding protein 1-like [Myotis brandtii]|uniref:guanylate-binding protein 1-like n=1 Tax=Myotis brandtii TaxID=109478 RepID=UPI0007045F87|nr:PREDICTED: guanylate-binding protein 1-like [Myotis brandtii]